jgi:hypothetical protein
MICPTQKAIARRISQRGRTTRLPVEHTATTRWFIASRCPWEGTDATARSAHRRPRSPAARGRGRWRHSSPDPTPRAPRRRQAQMPMVRIVEAARRRRRRRRRRRPRRARPRGGGAAQPADAGACAGRRCARARPIPLRRRSGSTHAPTDARTDPHKGGTEECGGQSWRWRPLLVGGGWPAAHDRATGAAPSRRTELVVVTEQRGGRAAARMITCGCQPPIRAHSHLVEPRLGRARVAQSRRRAGWPPTHPRPWRLNIS